MQKWYEQEYKMEYKITKISWAGTDIICVYEIKNKNDISVNWKKRLLIYCVITVRQKPLYALTEDMERKFSVVRGLAPYVRYVDIKPE